ncbi:mucin-3A-like [Maniola jurtina]|uniref:mucin-3A-like n=1 Tax=Maniola jurtina TaxID=191418 RepID=UPI001E6872A0|nr:mucin-3A-like [Maniola jurtina]
MAYRFGAAKERRPFLRRTKATAPPDTTDADTTTSAVETTTNRFTRRGNNRFKTQKTEEKPRENEAEKPSSNGVAARSDRPRNFVRRRFGGANSTSTTAKPAALVPLRREPFRVASRRRPLFSTTTTTTSKPTTAALLESDESLQDIDIGDIDAIEDPSLKPSTTQRPTTNVQRRRPLVQLKSEDQNQAATNEEEKKRQSKKYSSSFKQNQLDEILRVKSSAEEIDVTTEGKTTIEDISAETAVALAAHQLLGAPVPVIPDYDDEPKSTRRPPQTIVDYKFTSPEYTEDYTRTQSYDEYTRTPSYTTRHRFAETPTGTYASLQTDEVPSSTRSSLETDTSVPAFTTTRAYTSRFSRPTFDATNTDPTIPGVTLSLGSEGSGESTARYTNFPTESTVPSYTTTNYESRASRPGFSTVNPTTASVNFRESTLKYTNTERDVSPTYPTGFTSRVSRPAGFSPNLVNIDEVNDKSTVRFSPSEGPSTARYEGSSDKIPAPLVFGYSTGGQGLQEPSYFTREYLLESPVTKSYDDEYQYLSPKVTTPQPSSRKPVRRKFVNRRISTTQSPTSALPQTTLKPRRTTIKPFEKIPIKDIPVVKDSDLKESVQTIQRTVGTEKRPIEKFKQTAVQKLEGPGKVAKPIRDYDYYDDDQEKFVQNLKQDKKVILLKTGYQVSIKAPPRMEDAPPRNFIVFFGNIECLDIGNFPHPTSCKKFISCARMESGEVRGWEYVCPKGLSFDPVGGICNWSAGLGCSEKDA